MKRNWERLSASYGTLPCVGDAKGGSELAWWRDIVRRNGCTPERLGPRWGHGFQCAALFEGDAVSWTDGDDCHESSCKVRMHSGRTQWREKVTSYDATVIGYTVGCHIVGEDRGEGGKFSHRCVYSAGLFTVLYSARRMLLWFAIVVRRSEVGALLTMTAKTEMPI